MPIDRSPDDTEPASAPGPMNPPRHLRRHDGAIHREDRERRLGQRGAVLWLTGLSGSGKSSLAFAVEERLARAGRFAYVLDGDTLRHGLCADLGFSPADRRENIRRVSHVAALLADAGILVIAAFVSPFRADRAAARAVVGKDFLEVHVDAPLAVCEARDPKGLYTKARAGEIPDFTGIGSPYEPPEQPDLHLRTGERTLAECTEALLSLLTARGLLAPPGAAP